MDIRLHHYLACTPPSAMAFAVGEVLLFLAPTPSLSLSQQSLKFRLIPRHTEHLVRAGRHDEVARVLEPARRVDICHGHAGGLLEPEAGQQPHEDEVDLPHGQEVARTHPVAEAEGEERRVGLLEPALWPEDVGVFPKLGVCF